VGKLKQSLIDTEFEDQTDPRDTGNYGEPEQTEPTQASFNPNEFDNAVEAGDNSQNTWQNSVRRGTMKS